MKKTGIILAASIGVLIIFAAFITPSDPPPTDPPTGIGDSVWTVIQNSCYDCHANDGNGMAKAKLNFDKWGDYSADKQAAKAKAICKVLQKGKMPPSKYRKNNPESVPTDVETALICDWANN